MKLENLITIHYVNHIGTPIRRQYVLYCIDIVQYILKGKIILVRDIH